MAGSSSISGDESIIFANNASFDGTERGGKLTTDGQLWIGATVAPHVKKGTITSPNGSIVVGYSSPDITLETTEAVFAYTLIDNTDSPYTVLSDDFYISADTTAGAITITLPNAPTTFRRFIIKDHAGTASTNNISVTTAGGVVTIDGQTTYVIAGNYGAINLLFNGTSYEVY
jgi:hypothetical protein